MTSSQTARDETIERLTRERDGARGVIDYLLTACRLEHFSDGLQSAKAYVDYSLGTASLLYHVEGYEEIVRERDRYRSALADIVNTLTLVGTDVNLDYLEDAARDALGDSDAS